jgi:hypothetical protein
MAARGHTMPLLNEARPHAPEQRRPLAPLPPLVMVAIGAAAVLLAAIWIGSCLLLQSN